MGRESGARTAGSWRSVVLLTMLVPVLVGVGCQRADPIKDLRDRATKYWQLKQSKSWAEVYDQFLDPSVKGQLTKEAFLKRRFLAFDIFSFEVADIKAEGDKATVAVTNEVNFPLKAPTGQMQFIKKQVTTNDTWVRRDGTWYVELTE